MKVLLWLLACNLLLLVPLHCYIETDPIWLTSSYMRAGNEDVIKTLTGESYDPIYTFTFSSALPGVPNLAYGIKRYRGNDYMGQEMFEIRRLNLTAGTFTVQVDIIGVTNIHIFNVPYIAVDPTFPHHLNGFDNVPINYGGTLVNITVEQASSFYSNTVNYTEQANGRAYKTFDAPLDGNKILLYITSLRIWASFASGGVKYPIDLDIDYQVLSASQYKMTAALSTEVYIQQIHFSQIIFNVDDVESSQKYYIVYQLWEVDKDGGFIEFPQEFTDNFIMGVTDFETVDGRCGFEYQWVFATKNGKYGAEVLESVQLSGDCGFSKMTSTVFYMMTWQCPTGASFFNLTTNLCQDYCGQYHFENLTTMKCDRCPEGCTTCINSTHCLTCDSTTDHRYLETGSSGEGRCVCEEEFFDDLTKDWHHPCDPCINGCLDCPDATSCLVCDFSFEQLLIPNGTCQFCGNDCVECNNDLECQKCGTKYLHLEGFVCMDQCPDYFFGNSSTEQCEDCAFACSDCSSALVCEGCKSSDNRELTTNSSGFASCTCKERYFQDPDNSSNTVCLACIDECLTCSSTTTCDVCNTAEWFLLLPNKTCHFCGVGCSECSAGKQCTACANGYYFNATSKACQLTCDDLGYFYANDFNNQCDACAFACYSCSNDTECLSCNSTVDHRELGSVTGLSKCVCEERFYEVNSTALQCEACILECLTCNDSTSCIECNAAEQFLLIPNNTCHFCGDDCVQCNNDLECQACGTKYLNATDFQCQDACASYFFANDANQQCDPCAHGCLTCDNNSTCATCSAVNDFRELDTSSQMCVCMQKYHQDTLSATNTVCEPCIDECLTCDNPSTCQVCNQAEDFLLIPNNTCHFCGVDCVQCNNDLECQACGTKYLNATDFQCQDSCANYFFANDANHQCDPCAHGCHTCSTGSKCLSCNENQDLRQLEASSQMCVCMERYHQDTLNSTNTVCQACIDECLTCDNPNTCQVCNNAQGYLLLPNQTCHFCGFGCATCNNSLFCQSCLPSFIYDPQDGSCSCPDGKYKETSSITCQPCSDRCLTCAGPSEYECLSCPTDQNRIQLKQNNAMVQCICNSFNYVEASNGSAVCVKASQESCDAGYIYIKNLMQCHEICGDGLHYGMFECDDGNEDSGDGCSNKCVVEEGFACTENNLRSTCVFDQEIEIVDVKSFKSPFGNSVLLECKLSPFLSFFNDIDWLSGLTLEGAKIEIDDAYIEDLVLKIDMQYFEDLTDKLITIRYESNRSGRRLFTTNFGFDITLKDYAFPVDPSNNLELSYQEQGLYSMVEAMQRVTFSIASVCICAVVLSLFLKTALPILQLTLAVQLLFMSLGTIIRMNPLLSVVTEFSPLKGVRSTKLYFEEWTSPQDGALGFHVEMLGYVSSFFGNMNIMLFLVAALGLSCFAACMMARKDLQMKPLYKVCRRQLLLVLLLAAMNTAFSSGLFTEFYLFEVIVAALTAALILGQLIHLIRSPGKYYWLDVTFDLETSAPKAKQFIACLIAFRVLAALCVSLLRTHTTLSCCLLFALQLFFSVGLTVLRPYKRHFNNHALISVEWAAMAFLTLNMMIKFKMAPNGEIFLSLVQVIVVNLIAILSVPLLVHAFYYDFCHGRNEVMPSTLMHAKYTVGGEPLPFAEGANKASGKQKIYTKKEDINEAEQQKANEKMNIVEAPTETPQVWEFESLNEQMNGSKTTLNLDELSPQKKKRRHK